MNDNFIKYIKNEKDISRYKISVLEKRPNKNYTYRLISIEKDFLEYPFEKIDFKDLDGLRNAISLFKIDRGQFEKRFAKNSVFKTIAVSNQQILILKKKLKYYEDLYKYLLDVKVKKINLLQDEYIKSKLKSNNKKDPPIGIDGLTEAEGVHLAKKRARIQILTYCLSRFIYHETKRINDTYDFKDSSFESYENVRKILDNLFVDINHNIYKHYNNGIKEVPLLINGTLGHNNFVHTIYPLVNLMDKYPGNYFVKRILQSDKSFFNKNKIFINKKFVKRGFGIITPMERTGNESITLLYLDLWTDNGISIRSIMEKDFFNYNLNGKYFKTISTKPIWTFNENINNKFLLREALSMLELDQSSLVDEIDFNDPIILDSINKSEKGNISICSESSKIFISATRSESEHIKEAYEWIELLIKEIKNDYKDIFSPITLKDKEREYRMDRVKDIKG
jgi:hypothetical protein